MLHGALESLICQETNGKFSYEIILVNDGSTDGTSDVVKKITRRYYVHVEYVYQKGKGIAAPMNRGIKESRGQWIAFFDDDQLAEPSWLKEIIVVSSEKGTHCIWGTRLLSFLGPVAFPLNREIRAVLGEEN